MSLTLEFDVDDGVVLGLGIFVNLHKVFCDKSILSVCVDAGLHKILVRYANQVLVVDAVDECLTKVLNDWKNFSSSVDSVCGEC